MGRSEANLQKITKEIAKARGRAGGIASGKKRRELKTARDLAKMLLDLPISPQQEKIAAIAEAYGIRYQQIAAVEDMDSGIEQLLADGFTPTVMANIKDDGFSLETLRAIHAIPSSY